MNFCTNCGSKFSIEARFCASCGSPRQVGVAQSTPLLEYGVAPTPFAGGSTSSNVGQPFTPSRPSSTSTLVMVLSIIQLASVLVYVVYLLTISFDFDFIKSIVLPNLVMSAAPAVPIVIVGLVPKFRQDRRAMMAGGVSGAVLGYQGIVALFNSDTWGGGFEKTLYYLSRVGLASGVALAALLLVGVGLSKVDLAPESERWRGALGFISVLFLFLENPGEVLYQEWPALSLFFFPLVLLAFTLKEDLRQGAALGLTFVIGGSLVAQSMYWLLSSDWYQDSNFTSIPRVLALLACVGALIPKSLFTGSSGVRPLTS